MRQDVETKPTRPEGQSTQRPFCLDLYSPEDPALKLTSGHVVGQTCVFIWVRSYNAQAISCPHCKQILCLWRKRILTLLTPEQMARAGVLQKHHTKLEPLALSHGRHGTTGAWTGEGYKIG